MKSLANVISYLFHPVYMPTAAMLIVLNAGIYIQFPFLLKLYFTLVTFVFTCLFPLLSIFLLRYMKLVSSVHMPHRQERRLPLIMASVFFFTAYFLLHSQELSQLMDTVMLAAVFTMICLLMVNFLYKLSIHMAALGSLTALLTVFSLIPGNALELYLVGSIAASGLVGFARLALKAHSAGEVICGYAVGFTSQYLVLYLLLVYR